MTPTRGVPSANGSILMSRWICQSGSTPTVRPSRWLIEKSPNLFSPTTKQKNRGKWNSREEYPKILCTLLMIAQDLVTFNHKATSTTRYSGYTVRRDGTDIAIRTKEAVRTVKVGEQSSYAEVRGRQLLPGIDTSGDCNCLLCFACANERQNFSKIFSEVRSHGFSCRVSSFWRKG